jgi:hypothetical protein
MQTRIRGVVEQEPLASVLTIPHRDNDQSLRNRQLAAMHTTNVTQASFLATGTAM